MTSLKTIAAAAVLSALTATPVFAQAAIQEPGAFAFYHPDLDVLNGGAPTPAARLAAELPTAATGNISSFARMSGHNRHRND
ncbi:hypothetical protein [Bradyrhizobium sp. Ash2021]|uniref:hypothetical protein n=1 Tax=Bradyrhizobium sp. Ash2021 TaxID=2954771 RepID=UPI00281551DE|nr:hypothetical protein [Bradyrhizobium sp. Ash2021]WMT78443.1 hypothetical protein NL528_19785 [Bradyrhizobium sp. Ash2021]